MENDDKMNDEAQTKLINQLFTDFLSIRSKTWPSRIATMATDK
jgi:hypothetical protein